MENTCKTCMWHMHERIDNGFICVNDRSPYLADWTEDDQSCDAWEAIDERST